MTVQRLSAFTISGVVAFLLLAAAPCLAEEQGGRPGQLLVSEFEAGYTYMNFRYKEPDLMKETGGLNGVFARYTHHFRRGMMVRVAAEALYGSLYYDGQYQDGTPATANNQDWLVGGRLLAGKDFLLDKDEKWAVTPFIGFAARYWNDDIRTTGGYEREITQLYSPIGLELNSMLGERWRWGARAEYDFFWRGWVKSRMSEVAGYEDIQNNQDTGSGHGVQAALFLKYRLEEVSLVLEPFYRYWRVSESDSDTSSTPTGRASFVEPKNHTHIYGFRLAVAF